MRVGRSLAPCVIAIALQACGGDDAATTVAWSKTFDGTLSYPLIAAGKVFVIETALRNRSIVRLHALDRATGAVAPSGLDPTTDINVLAPTRLAAGEGHLVVPARNTLTAFRLLP